MLAALAVPLVVVLEPAVDPEAPEPDADAAEEASETLPAPTTVLFGPTPAACF